MAIAFHELFVRCWTVVLKFIEVWQQKSNKPDNSFPSVHRCNYAGVDLPPFDCPFILAVDEAIASKPTLNTNCGENQPR